MQGSWVRILCITLIYEVWLKSLAYPSGEEGGKFLVQIISTCLRYVERKGGGYRRRVFGTEVWLVPFGIM